MHPTISTTACCRPVVRRLLALPHRLLSSALPQTWPVLLQQAPEPKPRRASELLDPACFAQATVHDPVAAREAHAAAFDKALKDLQERWRMQDMRRKAAVLRAGESTASKRAAILSAAIAEAQSALAGKESAPEKAADANDPPRIEPPRPSNVAVGLSFELRIVSLLNDRHGFDVMHMGKAGDGGLDFKGHLLPDRLALAPADPDVVATEHQSPPASVPVLGQCKALKIKMSPASLHSFIAVLADHNRTHHGSSSTAHDPTNDATFLGVFMTEKGYSKGTLEWSARTPHPLVLMQAPNAVADLDSHSGVEFCYINPAARTRWPWLTTEELRRAEKSMFYLRLLPNWPASAESNPSAT
ncbi:hypothetical protein AMAG_12615 [Allomyces macrogynus ATCC 38327]|uniref:Required for respiratory growth protein 7, mitochondrial n=1 Tax=Allomyces macrogynus (strain ATCC 38327) TaxID=578462 RepID=A0A0L0SZB9_ALLM3|nr:hypothetical protein AMAG_12615 [Allomyces macrogynus ATCC 38327]|eukprot:KNE67898.1 hypothetical protein AMAG_12615 [Allomyces macrogynus ATCC 38327]